MSSSRAQRNGTAKLVVGVDRIVFTSHADLNSAVAQLTDFRCTAGHLMNNDASEYFSAYNRVRDFVNDTTGTKLSVSYKPRYNRRAPLRATVVPDDIIKLQRPELEGILEAFTPYRLVIVELAIDFVRTR